MGLGLGRRNETMGLPTASTAVSRTSIPYGTPHIYSLACIERVMRLMDGEMDGAYSHQPYFAEQPTVSIFYKPHYYALYIADDTRGKYTRIVY